MKKYGELIWNQPLERTDLRFDPDELKKDLGLKAIQEILEGQLGQLRVIPSEDAAVEEGALQQFNITIFDIDEGAVPSGDISIVGISAVMEKSTGGGAFNSTGITQPTFSKGDGRVYCAYQFLAAQWAMGDMYKLTVNGITALIDGETAYIPMMVWSNLVVEVLTLKTEVEAIQADIGNLQAIIANIILDTQIRSISGGSKIIASGVTKYFSFDSGTNGAEIIAIIIKGIIGADWTIDTYVPTDDDVASPAAGDKRDTLPYVAGETEGGMLQGFGIPYNGFINFINNSVGSQTIDDVVIVYRSRGVLTVGWET